MATSGTHGWSSETRAIGYELVPAPPGTQVGWIGCPWEGDVCLCLPNCREGARPPPPLSAKKSHLLASRIPHASPLGVSETQQLGLLLPFPSQVVGAGKKNCHTEHMYFSPFSVFFWSLTKKKTSLSTNLSLIVKINTVNSLARMVSDFPFAQAIIHIHISLHMYMHIFFSKGSYRFWPSPFKN